VVEAFAALEPGRAELTGVAHERGWTGVRLDLPLALRFAPRLARVLERVVLVWTVDTDDCRVSLFDPAGGMVEAARPDQVADLVRAFRAARPEYDSGVGLVEWGGSPRQRHAALAAALGVPDTVPGSAWEPGQAPAGDGERRIRLARDVLHLVSGFAVVGTVLFVLWPSVAGIVATVVIAGLAQAVRFWLGRIRL